MVDNPRPPRPLRPLSIEDTRKQVRELTKEFIQSDDDICAAVYGDWIGVDDELDAFANRILAVLGITTTGETK